MKYIYGLLRAIIKRFFHFSKELQIIVKRKKERLD